MPAKKTQKKHLDRQEIVSIYMNYVLENETFPKSVYKFCKEVSIPEKEFYQYFGSFEGLRNGVWMTFFEITEGLLKKNEQFDLYDGKEKMLTFFYTFFEMLSANRSYVLFSIKHDGGKDWVKNLDQFKGLRKHIKAFSAQVMQVDHEKRTFKFSKNPVDVFSEGAWFHFLFLLKFWLNDNSPSFEKTDVAIEKSVQAIYAIFDSSVMDNVLDFGKFVWKEAMNN